MKNVPSTRWIFGLAVTATLSATNLVAQGPAAPPVLPRGPIFPGQAGENPNVAEPHLADARRLCRGSSTPGWIAIDYIRDERTCPADAVTNKVYSTAVILPYTAVRVGHELEVCAAEPVPANWVAVRDIPNDPRCPVEPGKTAEATVKVIRRIR
jgi:hypothetical protein